MSYKDKHVIYQNIVMEDDGNNFEETVMDEESEIEIDQNINIVKKEYKEIDTSYENKSEYDDGEDICSTKNSESVFVAIKQEWAAEGEASSKTLDSLDSDDERTEFYIERATEGEDEDDEDDEEETIAMFVTASGQQLALYAVEDSDDYFAVAVYDESGEPPSNFQFLMKSDVERLIREGAVRTVKKPIQIKKQLVTTQPPVFIPKEEITGDITKTENRIEAMKYRNLDNKKTKITTNYMKPVIEDPPTPKIIRLDDSGSEEELVEQSTVQYILCDGDQSDTELTFDEIQTTLQGLKTSNSKKHHKNISIEKPVHNKTNNGLVYITAPSICNTSYRGAFYSNPVKIDTSSKSQIPVKRSHISNTSIIGSKQNHGIKRELSPMTDYYTPNTSANFSLSESLKNANSQSKVKRPRKQQLTSVNREDSEIIIQPASMLDEEEEIPIPKKKGKRRKKTVHEKISKLPTRKSTRRRRTRVEIIDIDADEEDSDEPSIRKEVLEITIDENKEKGSSDKENEVIMVGDSDDEDDVSSKTNSLTCKHCSKIFKQRRAFDSHTRVCTKLRSRSRRLSDRLSRDESDSEDESSGDKKIIKSKDSKEKSSKPKKEYTCKTCEDKFDMVVTLARHVRAEHSPRKRGRPSKVDSKKLKTQVQVTGKKGQEKKNAEEKSKDKRIQEEREEEDDEEDDDDEEEEELTEKETVSKKREESEEDNVLEEEEASRNEEVAKHNSAKIANIDSQSKMMKLHNKKKLIANLHRKWKFAELICAVCNRWLPSASAYENHTLQHFTKRSSGIFKSRSIYQCPVCNKLFKSEFKYMKHKRMHTKAVESIKSEESKMSKTTQNEEKGTSKVSAIRRRGRPRKLKSNI